MKLNLSNALPLTIISSLELTDDLFPNPMKKTEVKSHGDNCTHAGNILSQYHSDIEDNTAC